MSKRQIEWVNAREFDRARASEHFLVIGASGSGKTTILNNLMASVLTKGALTKGMVYDPKQELVPLLYELHGIRTDPAISGAAASVRILNPFDRRCFAWNIAKDIDNVINARQIATILVPDSASGKGSETFFTSAVRDILTAVMMSLIETLPNKGSWTFRDLILGVLYEPYLRFLLERGTIVPAGRAVPMLGRVLDTYLGAGADARTVGNIRASLSANLSIYEPIASAWHVAAPRSDSARMFSLKDWALNEGEEILVLGNDEASRAALDAINQAMFKRATELVLSRKEQPEAEKLDGTKQTWFFLDEIREAGKLEGLSRLLTKGRSKGACVVLGFQDIDGMRDVYGEEVANELCAQCNNVAVMRLNSPSTASWASELFGRRLTESRNKNMSLQSGGEGGVSLGKGTAEEERPFLYTQEFLYLKTARESRGVEGFVKGPGIEPTGKTNLEARASLFFRVVKETKARHPDAAWQEPILPRSSGDYLLQPWSKSDWERLGFEGPFRDLLTPPAAPEKKQAPEPSGKQEAPPSQPAEDGPKAYGAIQELLAKRKGAMH